MLGTQCGWCGNESAPGQPTEALLSPPLPSPPGFIFLCPQGLLEFLETLFLAFHGPSVCPLQVGSLTHGGSRALAEYLCSLRQIVLMEAGC